MCLQKWSVCLCLYCSYKAISSTWMRVWFTTLYHKDHSIPALYNCFILPKILPICSHNKWKKENCMCDMITPINEYVGGKFLLGNTSKGCWYDHECFFLFFTCCYSISLQKSRSVSSRMIRVYWLFKSALSSQCRFPCFGCEGQRSCSWERGDYCKEQRRGLPSCAGDHAGRLMPLEK